MLDHIAIFRKCGAVLWSQSWASLKGDPMNALIHGVLLEGRSGTDLFQDPNYSVKWASGESGRDGSVHGQGFVGSIRTTPFSEKPGKKISTEIE